MAGEARAFWTPLFISLWYSPRSLLEAQSPPVPQTKGPTRACDLEGGPFAQSEPVNFPVSRLHWVAHLFSAYVPVSRVCRTAAAWFSLLLPDFGPIRARQD